MTASRKIVKTFGNAVSRSRFFAKAYLAKGGGIGFTCGETAPAPGYLLDRTPRAVGRGLAIDVGCQRVVPSRSPSSSLLPSRSRFVRGSRRTHAGGSCPLRNTSQGPCPHARFRYTSPNLAAETRWPQACETHSAERGGMRRRRPRQRRLRAQQMRRPAVTSLVAGSTRGTALRRRQLRPPAALGARAALALAVHPRPTHRSKRHFQTCCCNTNGWPRVSYRIRGAAVPAAQTSSANA